MNLCYFLQFFYLLLRRFSFVGKRGFCRFVWCMVIERNNKTVFLYVLVCLVWSAIWKQCKKRKALRWFGGCSYLRLVDNRQEWKGWYAWRWWWYDDDGVSGSGEWLRHGLVALQLFWLVQVSYYYHLYFNHFWLSQSGWHCEINF